ncbi:RNA-binding protein [Bacillus cereus group sp. BfR-BA-01349]|uniref:RNA-binding protein n=1 Tax=Bacillus cereus group sp. BfR-BA-01349 TaxID=2920312 RepID=UPI001F5AD7E1
MKEMKQEVYDSLAAAKRNKEFFTAMVRNVNVQKMNMPGTDGKLELRDVECVYFALEGGALGMCPANEFSEYEHKSLNSFTGTIQEFIVLGIDKENNLAAVSVKQADDIKKEKFLKEIYKLEEENTLNEKVFEGIVTGRNENTRTIFLKVEGTPCFMKLADLDHERVFDIDSIAPRNATIPVKVKRFKEDTKQIQVSRKDAVEDPFEELRDKEPHNYTATGLVTNVSERDGIFVKLGKGFTIKASKPREVQEPVIGDIVAVRIVDINIEKRSARGVIFSYPQGKKQPKNLTSFLYN